jgi:hypothetical protein
MPGLAKLTPEIISAAVKWRRAGVPIAQIAKRIETLHCVRVTPQAVHQALSKLRIETKLARAKRVRASVSTDTTRGSSRPSGTSSGGAAHELDKLHRAVRRVRKNGSASVQLRAAAEERAILLAKAKIDSDATATRGDTFAGLAELLACGFDDDERIEKPAAWIAGELPRIAAQLVQACDAIDRVTDRTAIESAIAIVAPALERATRAIKTTEQTT